MLHSLLLDLAASTAHLLETIPNSELFITSRVKHVCSKRSFSIRSVGFDDGDEFVTHALHLLLGPYCVLLSASKHIIFSCLVVFGTFLNRYRRAYV